MKKANSAVWEYNTLTNKNISWVYGHGMWSAYIAFIILCRLLLTLTPFSSPVQWTITNLTHAIITWYCFHWQKGVPFSSPDEQGKYANLTFWEQLDAGVQLTPTRKFFTIVPIILYLITVHYSGYTGELFFYNTVAVSILLISKLPLMHGVRLFGINKN